MKRTVFSVFLATLFAISLLPVTTQSVLADPESYNVNADVHPLVIEINGDSATGQVFYVGQTLDFDGYVSSIASISGSDLLEAYITWDLDLTWHEGHLLAWAADGRSAGDWDQVDVTADNASISLQYNFTAPGEYTIVLNSRAVVSQWQDEEDEEPIWEEEDNAQVRLCFSVINPKTADLITEGGDNPTDIGDLYITYADGEYKVEFILDEPWEIVNTQVYIGTDVPNKSSPGQFPYTAGVINELSSPPPPTPPVYIAAHAKIRMQTGVDKRGNPIYAYAGVWAQTGSNDTKIGKGANWATCFRYPIPPP